MLFTRSAVLMALVYTALALLVGCGGKAENYVVGTPEQMTAYEEQVARDDQMLLESEAKAGPVDKD